MRRLPEDRGLSEGSELEVVVAAKRVTVLSGGGSCLPAGRRITHALLTPGSKTEA